MGRALLALLTAALLLPASAMAQPCPIPLPIPQCQAEPEPEPTPDPPPDQPPQRPQGPPPPPVSAVEGSATIGVDPAHTGYFADPNLATPLERRWRRRLRGGWDAPLYGQGRIYVSAPGTGTLRAIDPRTGRDIWTVAANGIASAYEDGRVYMVDGVGGNLRAHSAADGSVLWTSRPDHDYIARPSLVATGGVVYAPLGNGGVFAVDAASGAARWSSAGTGLGIAPAVDDGRVYVAGHCNSVHAWNRLDGSAAWASPERCAGGPIGLPVVYRGRIYAGGNGSVYDTATGAQVGTFAGAAPAFAGDVGVFNEGETMRGVDLDDGRELWKVRVPRSTVTQSWLDRIISGSTVYAMTSTRLEGIDLRAGHRMWSAAIDDNASPQQNDPRFGVAPGLLLTAAGRDLVAWENVFNPGPRGIEIGPRFGSAVSGRKALVGGIVGQDLRAGEVRLEVDPAPFGRFKRDIRGTIQPDGWVGFRIDVDRNIRVRLTAGGRRSNVSTLYAYPRVGFKVARAGASRFRTTATLRYARGRGGLGGRRAYLYLGRIGRKRYVRMGVTTARAAGRTAARAVFVHGAPAGVQPNDTIAVCVRGQARAGLGRNAGMLRRCGRRSIRF